MINLRDKGAELWEGANRLQRTAFALVAIFAALCLPYAGNFSLTNFLNTPISSYEAVLVYPVGMYILMALGLNIVVGKSGLLDLGYVAFFAIGAYTAAILGTHTHLNTWEILPMGMGFAMLAGVLLGLPTLRLRGDYLAIVTLGFGARQYCVQVDLKRYTMKIKFFRRRLPRLVQLVKVKNTGLMIGTHLLSRSKEYC